MGAAAGQGLLRARGCGAHPRLEDSERERVQHEQPPPAPPSRQVERHGARERRARGAEPRGPAPGPARPAPAAAPFKPLPARVKPERPTRRRTSPGPTPGTAPSRDGTPSASRSPPAPPRSPLLRPRASAPEYRLSGTPFPRQAETICGSPPRVRPLRRGSLAVGEGRGIKGRRRPGPRPATWRAHSAGRSSRYVPSPSQIRWCGGSGQGSLINSQFGWSGPRLVISFFLCDILKRARSWKLLKDRKSYCGFWESDVGVPSCLLRVGFGGVKLWK